MLVHKVVELVPRDLSTYSYYRCQIYYRSILPYIGYTNLIVCIDLNSCSFMSCRTPWPALAYSALPGTEACVSLATSSHSTMTLHGKPLIQLREASVAASGQLRRLTVFCVSTASLHTLKTAPWILVLVPLLSFLIKFPALFWWEFASSYFSCFSYSWERWTVPLNMDRIIITNVFQKRISTSIVQT